MGRKSTFAEGLLAGTVVLSVVTTAISQTDRAAEDAYPAGHLFAPQLTIGLRSSSKSELADTWPAASFVPRRLTSAPRYDPAFRLPGYGDQRNSASVAARNERGNRE